MATDSRPTKLGKPVVFAVVAVAGLALSAWGWSIDPTQFFRSYLVAWVFWLAIPLGSLMLLLLHNLTGGAWGWAIHPFLIAAASTLPLVGLLFLPIGLDLIHIYQWADESHVVNDPILAHKQPYLNPRAFLLRAGVYWLIWLALLFFIRWSSRRRYPAESEAARRVRMASGMGIAISGVAITFASFDLAMSLEPHWFSTIYGVIFVAAQGLAALAFAIAAVVRIGSAQCNIQTGPDDLHDLGKLLFAFTMFWAYVSFSQFLIVWYGNLPEEVPWYQRRFEHGWQWVAIVIALFHFVVPFLILLGRRIKRQACSLASIAIWILAMRWLDTVWQIEPAFEREAPFVPWIDLALTAGIGGLWMLYFTWLLEPAALAGRIFPREQEVLLHE
jgi:hypothetical protein